jgi:pyrophosphatase PpaX
MIKAVLFDFDGTLINTNELIFASYQHAFRTVLGREITKKEIQSLYGRPLYSSLSVYGEHQDDLYSVYREYNAIHHDAMIQKFDGASEGVRALRRQGKQLAVVTSKRSVTLQKGLEFLEIADCFDVLITPDDTDKHKPDPMPVQLACDRLNVPPEQAVMVGDSIFDFQSARAAGAQLAAVTYSTTLDDILAYRPEYVVNSVLELADKLESA